MELIDVAIPKILNDKDVLIRLKVVAVCGSDVHYYVSGKIGSQVVQYPFPVGHECAGIVEKIGSAVTHLSVGDRVAIDPAMHCGECDQCKAGRPHTCRALTFLGCPGQADGCLSEFIVMPEHTCFPIPDTMTLDEAAISEPLAIGVYAVNRSVPMKGMRVGVLGYGPIGMSVHLAAAAKGATGVYVSDKIDGRLKVACKSGVNYAGNVTDVNVVAEVLDKEPQGLDVVFECCGQQEAVDQAFELLKPGGVLMLIGIPQFGRWSLPVDMGRHKEISVINVRRQNGVVEETLSLMENEKIDVSTMVTHRFSFADSKKAFDLVASYSDGVMKAMIDF